MFLTCRRYGILLIGCCLSFSISAKSFRGARYCEILFHKQGSTLEVYNTINLNDCPEALWKKITVESIRKETGKIFVHLNGPRYFMFDEVKNTALISQKVRTFGNLQMREAGILHVTPRLLITHTPHPYTEQEVERHTTWVYKTGLPVYELISPDHQIYVMQSYTTQKQPTLTESNLNQLAKQLTLPKGWQFKMGVLKTDQEVPAIEDKAWVITDNFLNTYQKSMNDLLK